MIPTRLRRPRLAVTALLLAVACRGEFEPDPTGPVTPPPPPPAAPLIPFIVGSFTADYATGVASDAAGNAVVVGYFGGSVDFAPGSSATIRAAIGPADISVAKYGTDGALLWVTLLGGSGVEIPNAVAVAGNGAIYVAGQLGGPGALCSGKPVLHTGSRDIVLARFSSAGACEWAHGIGSLGDDDARALVIDADGDVVVAGSFTGTVDFDPGSGAATLISRGGTDAFVARYAPSGAYRAVVQGGGLGDDAAVALALSEDGDLAVGGEFRGTATFGSTLSPLTLQSAGDADFWIARLAPSLALQWAVRGGGTGLDQLGTHALTFEPGGTVLAAGMFSGTADLDPGTGSSLVVSQGGLDVFVTRYGIGGAHFGFSRRFGGPSSDGVTGLFTDVPGNLYLSGWFQGTVDFDPGSGTLVRNALGTAGAADGFLLSLTPNGEGRWVTPIGGVIAGDANFAVAAGLAPTPDGAIWGVGRLFGLVDLDDGPGAVPVQGLGGGEQFVTRVESGTGVLRR